MMAGGEPSDLNLRLIPMKKQIFLTLTVLVVVMGILLSACAPSATAAPDDPVSSSDPTDSAPPADSLQPQPEDDQLDKGNAYIDATEILTLESFPPQFMLSITGGKPTPCHKLRAVISEPGNTNEIHVEVYTLVHPEAICIQKIENFNISLNLGTYPAGQYKVFVNDSEIGQIMAP